MTAVFIDGGYLDKVLYREHGNARIDLEKLSRLVAEPDELLRAYFYHCVPYQGNPPTLEESGRYAGRHRFVTKLSLLPRFEVRLGRLVCRGIDRTTGGRIFQQERVDCMIGVNKAILAGKGKITNAAIFTGDSDLMPAVESVKLEGVLTTLWHGGINPENRPSAELYALVDERRQLTLELVQSTVLQRYPTRVH
ncbi:MAG: NYN domain-containing protein [Bryobacteraceae bacterium]